MDFIKEAARYARTYQKEGKTPDVRIAVLGSASIQHFVMALRYALSREGLYADIYEGGYDGIAMDVFDTESPLYRFKPEIVVLLTHYLDIRQFPEILEEGIQIVVQVEYRIDGLGCRRICCLQLPGRLFICSQAFAVHPLEYRNPPVDVVIHLYCLLSGVVPVKPAKKLQEQSFKGNG